MKVVLDPGAYMPERAHETDAGLDLRTPDDVVIMPGKSAVIDTGVHIEIPHGFYGKLESKSGLNVNHDIVSLGGVIDEGYTGSIKVKLYNFGGCLYRLARGAKIVQLIIQPCSYEKCELAKSLNATERGNGGFGSTGK